MSGTPRLQRAWPATIGPALLVFLAVLLIAHLHYAGQTLARGPDQADITLSLWFDASRAIARDGIWAAMLTPNLGAGIANWANPNQNPLYPLYFNWVGADASVFATLDRLNTIIFVHLAILGAGGFYLARALGARIALAVCVGLVLPFFPAVRSAAAWPHIIAGLAWLPWVVGCLVRIRGARTLRDAWPAMLALVVAATLLVYAQPAQALVQAVVVCVLAWGLAMVQDVAFGNAAGGQKVSGTGETTPRVAAWRHAGLSSTWLAVCGVLVASMTGAYLFGLLRFHAGSIRWLGEYGGYLTGNQPVPIGALRVHSLAPGDTVMLVAFEYRRGIGNAYVGATLLLAACAAGVAQMPGCPPTQRHMTRALLACGMLALLACFCFMAPVLGAIPLVNRVREITWWSCVAVVLLVPLAGVGLQALAGRVDAARRADGRVPAAWRSDRWTWFAAIALLLALAATIATRVAYRGEAIVALLSGFAALACVRHAATRPARLLAAIVVLLCAAWIPFRHNIVFARGDATLFLPDRVQARSDAARLHARIGAAAVNDYRAALGSGIEEAHLLTYTWANAGFRMFGGGVGPMDYAHYQLLAAPTPTVSALYGLRWTVVGTAARQAGDVALRPGLWLRTDTAALPRLFFIGGGLRLVDDPVASLRALRSVPPTIAMATRGDLPADADAGLLSAGTAQLQLPHVTRNGPTAVHATLDTDRPGVLVLNETPEARWTARIDGRDVPAFRINGFQTAFVIPVAGTHAIEIVRPGPLLGRD